MCTDIDPLSPDHSLSVCMLLMQQTSMPKWTEIYLKTLKTYCLCIPTLDCLVIHLSKSSPNLCDLRFVFI